jgi:hypothetical protein
MMRHLSLTTRLTTLFAIVASIALAILGVTMIALDKHFEAQDRDFGWQDPARPQPGDAH